MSAIREARRQMLLELVTVEGLTKKEGIALAAEALHISPHTVAAWVKPETASSSLPPPRWALELLAIKRHGHGKRWLKQILSEIY